MKMNRRDFLKYGVFGIGATLGVSGCLERLGGEVKKEPVPQTPTVPNAYQERSGQICSSPDDVLERHGYQNWTEKERKQLVMVAEPLNINSTIDPDVNESEMARIEKELLPNVSKRVNEAYQDLKWCVTYVKNSRYGIRI